MMLSTFSCFFLIDHLCIIFGEGLCKYFDHFLIGIVLKYCFFKLNCYIYFCFYCCILHHIFWILDTFEVYCLKKSFSHPINSFHLLNNVRRKHTYFFFLFQFSSVQFSSSVVSDSLQPHEPQHTRPPCPSPTLGVYPNSCPLSW